MSETLCEFFSGKLYRHCLTEEQADEVMQRVIENNSLDQSKWLEDVNRFNKIELITIWINVEHEALSYIKEKYPWAWFRGLFER